MDSRVAVARAAPGPGRSGLYLRAVTAAMSGACGDAPLWWMGVTFGVSMSVSSGEGEGVMERAHGVPALDGDLELMAGAAIRHCDGDCVGDRVPEQADVDAVVLAVVELARLVDLGAWLVQIVGHDGELVAAGGP
jgi:hypothetical protein